MSGMQYPPPFCHFDRGASQATPFERRRNALDLPRGGIRQNRFQRFPKDNVRTQFGTRRRRALSRGNQWGDSWDSKGITPPHFRPQSGHSVSTNGRCRGASTQDCPRTVQPVVYRFPDFRSRKGTSLSGRMSPGNPRTRSAMMLRRISSLPPAIRKPGA